MEKYRPYVGRDKDDDGEGATVKNTYLGTSGPEKYFNVKITIPMVIGKENI